MTLETSEGEDVWRIWKGKQSQCELQMVMQSLGRMKSRKTRAKRAEESQKGNLLDQTIPSQESLYGMQLPGWNDYGLGGKMTLKIQGWAASSALNTCVSFSR